jgi:Rad3-related DNA helicase
MIWQYGKRISRVAREIPNGILIFFPQRALMLKAVASWRNVGVLNEYDGQLHLERRPVFIEGENSAENRIVVEEYKQEAHGDDGAALFAIFRGRNAEGSNFPDEEARGVFLVGVPYADYNDPIVKAQMAFFDRKRTGLGQRWYAMDAFRSANQAMGRGIRHREHWCTFVLMDDRYRSHINMVASWARVNGVESVQ